MGTTPTAQTHQGHPSATIATMHAGALELVGNHCDIEEHIKLVPATARVRGVIFRPIHAQLQKRGLLEAYNAYFADKHGAIPFYPLTDYLLRLAGSAEPKCARQRLCRVIFARYLNALDLPVHGAHLVSDVFERRRRAAHEEAPSVRVGGDLKREKLAHAQ